jgi:hypothetical protein
MRHLSRLRPRGSIPLAAQGRELGSDADSDRALCLKQPHCPHQEVQIADYFRWPGWLAW